VPVTRIADNDARLEDQCAPSARWQVPSGRTSASKSDWTWRTWPQAPQFYDPEVIVRMADREVTVRALIKQEIEKRLAAMGARARP
jgi:hypothetical protein